MSIKIPPSSTSMLGTAIPIAPLMIQYLVESDFGEALCCIFLRNIMSNLIITRYHDLKHGIKMVYSKLGYEFHVEICIFKLQQYKVVILLLWEVSYQLKDKVLYVDNLEWKLCGRK